MSSGEALVETGSAPVKASCLSFKLKLLIGLAVGTVVVSGAVSAGVLLSNNTNKSVDAVVNATTADSTANGTQTNTANGTKTSLQTTVDSLTSEYKTTASQTTNAPTNNQTLATETDITTVYQNLSDTVTADPLNNETLSQTITTNSNTSSTSPLMSTNTITFLGTTTVVLAGTQGTTRRSGTAPGVTSAPTTAAGTSQTMAPSTTTPLMRATTAATFPPTQAPTTELPTTTLPPCTASRSRTVIFMFYDGSGDLFLRGGPVDIDHLSLGPEFVTYNQQAATNTGLSWSHNSPTAKTSNAASSSIYYSLNTYGDNYWLMDVCMACPANGRFEIKGFTSTWEGDRSQDGSCSGSAGVTTVASSTNHQGMCGKINVFKFNQDICTIDNF